MRIENYVSDNSNVLQHVSMDPTPFCSLRSEITTVTCWARLQTAKVFYTRTLSPNDKKSFSYHKVLNIVTKRNIVTGEGF